MPKVTELIRYNLRDRGRKHRGKARNFNVPALVAAINGGAVQERVRHRDMHGYYGHWPRQVFGMNPKEGGIVDGKVVHIEPAFITTHLKAFDDGTIEHRTEFCDNAPGRAAAALYESKAGGWSSAIIESENQFFGFDYVFEPNFTHNRGYAVAMDSVHAGALTLDDVESYYDSAMEIVMVLDSVNRINEGLRSDLARMSKVVTVLQADRIDAEDALQRVLRKGAAAQSLDAVGFVSAPGGRGKTAAIFDRAHSYLDAPVAVIRERETMDSADAKDLENARSFWRG